MSDGLVAWLTEARGRERAMTRFYRRQAAAAGLEGSEEEVERLNELHADEQHHLSRLTARLLELGVHPAEEDGVSPPTSEDWESEARGLEQEEIAFYEAALAGDVLDTSTRAIVEEILESERHHARELGGKWMSA